jgi:hypothetical protein
MEDPLTIPSIVIIGSVSESLDLYASRPERLTIFDIEALYRSTSNRAWDVNGDMFWMRGFQDGDQFPMYGLQGGFCATMPSTAGAGAGYGWMFALDVNDVISSTGQVRAQEGQSRYSADTLPIHCSNIDERKR